jgi:hypothetical protein
MSKMAEIDADRQQIERLTDIVRPPSFSETARAGVLAHTPTPWAYRPNMHDDWGWIRGPRPDGENIAPLVALARGGSWEGEKTFDDHRRNRTDPYAANADLIIKAVNNHDALVSALEGMLRVCPSERAGKRLPEYDAARIAIARAKAGAA